MITSNQLADEGFGSILGGGHTGPERFFSDSLVLSLNPVRSLPGKSREDMGLSTVFSCVSPFFSMNDLGKEKLHMDLG